MFSQVQVTVVINYAELNETSYSRKREHNSRTVSIGTDKRASLKPNILARQKEFKSLIL